MTKKDSVLVLGAGNSRKQRMVFAPKGEAVDQASDFSDQFNEVVTIDIDPATKPTHLWDLEMTPWPVPREHFNEVHAYEVLEHLGAQGDYRAFFRIWREIWEVLKPEGIICATTPWWQSIWAFGDPGHRVVYSPACLVFLSQRQYEEQVGTTSMTDYRSLWPKPYDFMGVHLHQASPDSFRFVLQKGGKLADTTD